MRSILEAESPLRSDPLAPSSSPGERPSMTDDIKPALRPSEWAAIMARAEDLVALRDQVKGSPFSPHALAALFLYEQPFGFTPQDVIDEREVQAYCAAMAARHAAAGEATTAETFRLLGERHAVRADKIAALLPPFEAPDSTRDEMPR